MEQKVYSIDQNKKVTVTKGLKDKFTILNEEYTILNEEYTE